MGTIKNTDSEEELRCYGAALAFFSAAAFRAASIGAALLRRLINHRCRNGIASEVRHKHFRSTKSYGEWTLAGRIRSHNSSTRWTNFHQRAVAVVYYPQIHSVKSYPSRSITNLERAQVEPVGGAKLRQTLTEIICNPDIFAFRGNAERTFACWIRSQHCSSGTQARNAIAFVVCDPDVVSSKCNT